LLQNIIIKQNLIHALFLEDLSSSLISEVFQNFENDKQLEQQYPILSNPYRISPFAIPSNFISKEFSGGTPNDFPIKAPLLTNCMDSTTLVKTTYKEPSGQPEIMDSKSNGPYEKIANRKRRQRKGKIVHGRKEKQCEWCKTTQTPEWRTGPQYTTLCNACGLQFRKLNRMEEEQENRGRNAIKNVLNP